MSNPIPYNPYDFANPVSDQDFFVGRAQEIKDIRYYLDQAKRASHPINIALLGPRASGKTSLLNMIQHEALDKGFCVVRIDLDESDAHTELAFFFKVFDHIVHAAFERGAFGGLEGKTYDTYLDTTLSFDIPVDKTFSPFLFPLVYAKAMARGNENIQVPNNVYTRDLNSIRAEVQVPIAILFDEGNVLSNSRVILEKLRNIYQNLPGYVLVLAGTLDLFPAMDDVFSPIVRGFKKIMIGEFKSRQETRDLVLKPLRNIGLNPDELLDEESYGNIQEIHELSGGRPYEIQLLCHVMFRRVEEKRAPRMKLDLSVLEELRRELETSQDIYSRPVLSKVRRLAQRQLRALQALCACSGYATFEQLWAGEYILYGEDNWTKELLRAQLDYLTEHGVLAIDEDGIISFQGDDFDKVYTKYYAREQDVLLNFDMPLELYWNIHLDLVVSTNSLLIPTWSSFSEADLDLDSIISVLSDPASEEDSFVDNYGLAHQVYQVMMSNSDKEHVNLVRAKLSLPWLSVQSWYEFDAPTKGSQDGLRERLEEIGERIGHVGGTLLIEGRELPVIPLEILKQKVAQSGNGLFRRMTAEWHAGELLDSYAEEKDKDRALFHADLAYLYDPDTEAHNLNNIGYVFLSFGILDRARTVLDRAATMDEPPSLTAALAIYNLAILEAKEGNIEQALKLTQLAIDQSQPLAQDVRGCACLFVPQISEANLDFREVWEVDIVETAEEAKSVFECYVQNAPV